MSARTEIPLGQLENQRLELKSAAVLDSPEKIAREVVAMLNADGGEVWIGLREEDGRAMEIEPIRDPDLEKERLHDHLVDTLEPAPTGEEVAIEVVELAGDGEDGSILRIIAQPLPNRRPYSWVRNGGWNFPIRIGARLRPMSREEIFSQQSTTKAELTAEVTRAEKALIEERRLAIVEGLEGLWLAVTPVPLLDLQVQDALFAEIATDPQASGNRKTGWTFALTAAQPRLSADAIRWGRGFGPEHAGQLAVDAHRVNIAETGKANFHASFGALAGKGHDIWPFALLEYPVSAFRLLKQVFSDQADSSFLLLADLALLGVRGRRLARGSPGNLWFQTNDAQPFGGGDDLVLSKPLVFDRSEVIQEPDRCAYRLLKKVYQGFGYREEAIPREFDRKTGRLILPE